MLLPLTHTLTLMEKPSGAMWGSVQTGGAGHVVSERLILSPQTLYIMNKIQAVDLTAHCQK